LVLPDGTRVIVSANTTFTYPATFGKQSREVSLSGEAYFDVTHNAGLPFVVKSKDLSIKVLGTKFNVYAYPRENYFEASSVEGKIQAYSERNKKKIMTLLPNEKVRYNYANETFEKSTTDLQVETAWTRGDLYFQSETLLSILPKLERYYGVKFDINGQLPNTVLTASYHETDVNEILRNLAIHYRFSYTKNGEVIHLNIK
jgi:ferric-dicitrate binding protein FerR (iron transport regulator)